MVAEVKDLHSNNADVERMQQIFAAQKAAYRQHPYPSAEQRIELGTSAHVLNEASRGIDSSK